MNLKKERIAHNPEKRKLFVTLLFLFIAFICFSNVTNAQGWSFTFKEYAQGNCGGVQPPTINLPNLGIPTKSQCESLRQQILAIKGTSGNCTVGFTCTPCTGSDIIAPAQLSASPGNVSFDGQFEGKPLFTTHESQAFQDWAEGYKQQLESYGITSILGKNITSNQIPLTGNMNFDKFYYSQSATFNPATPPENLYTEDASVVDLRGKQGTVQLLRNAEDVKKENEWLKEQGLDNLKTIPKNVISDLDPIVLEPGSFWGAFYTDPEIVKMEQHALFVGIGLAATLSGVGVVAEAGAAASVGTAEVIAYSLPIVEESVKAIEDCISGNCPTTGKIIKNMGMAELSNLVGAAGEAVSGKIGAAALNGINSFNTSEIGKTTFKIVFGTLDQVRDSWETLTKK